MIEMRNAGATYQEIGNKYGITRQRTYEVLRHHCETKKYDEFKIEDCIYVGIRNWLLETKMPLHKLESIYKGREIKNSTSATRKRLIGKLEFKISEIERVLKYTGKTYEELFNKGE